MASLRKGFHNEFDETLTQNDLADLSRIPLITLQKIEQGRQTNLKPDLVVRLADALKLSSYFRQAFFLASLGLEENDLVCAKNTPEEVLDDLCNLLAHLQTPAYITNCFGDLVIANSAFLSIFMLDVQKIQQGRMLCKYNINRVFFSPEFEEPLRAMMQAGFPAFARRHITLFNAMTLRFRNHPYFQKILPELNRFPTFREHWQSPAFHYEDVSTPTNPASMTHPQLGPLRFMTAPSQALTGQGDLLLFNYLPLDAPTARTCIQLTEDLGTGPLEFSTWPIPARA